MWRGLNNKELHNSCSSRDIVKNDQTKKNEISGAYSGHRRDEKCVHHFGWETRKEETTWKLMLKREIKLKVDI